jgi:hypothetical protein
MDRVRSAGATGQKREGRRAETGTGHGGGEVVAGRRSGWRGARGKGQWGREARPGKGKSDAWGLPEQEVAPGRSWNDGERRGQSAIEEAEEQSRRQRKKKREGGLGDSFAKTEKSRDLTVN